MAPLCSAVLAVQNQPSNGVGNLPACLWGSLKREIPSLWDGSFASLALAKPGAETATLCPQISAKPRAQARCRGGGIATPPPPHPPPRDPGTVLSSSRLSQTCVIPSHRTDTPLPPNSVSKELSCVLPAPYPAPRTPCQHGQTLPTWARGRCSPYLLAGLSWRVRELTPSPALCRWH